MECEGKNARLHAGERSMVPTKCSWPARRNSVLDDLSQANTKLLSELDLPRPESVEDYHRGRCEDADVDSQTARLRPRQEMAGRFPRPRRPARRLGRRLELSLEPASCGPPRVTSSPCPNPRGSTGFGQKFVDEISGDWGGKCYVDLMAGARLPREAALRRQGPHRRGRGVVRRLHDGLVRRQHRPVQVA